MKKSLIALAVLAAASTGCASLTDAGHTSYTVRAAPAAEGKTVCYEFEAKDGKEFAGRAIQFQGTCGVGAVLAIQEGQSKAFRGQGIAAKALSVLPVTGLDDLIGK
jgi:hypothetical protein